MNPTPDTEYDTERPEFDAEELARFDAAIAAYEQTDPSAGRALKLTQASEITMAPVVWLWEDRIPLGAITLVPGREGIGKSLLLCWLIAQITRGTLPGVFHGTPRAVIYAASEDSWAQTIAPRLYVAGADLAMVFRVEVEQDGLHDQLTLPIDTSAMAKVITEHGIALLAADPLLSLIDVSLDTHRDRELRRALEPLARLADQTRCAVVGLAHFNKSSNTDALNLITGSRAFSAVARAVIAIAKDVEAEDGSCVLSQAKNNLGKTQGLASLRYVVREETIQTATGPAHVGRLEFTGTSDRTVDDVLAAAARRNDGSGGDRASKAAAWLAGYLGRNGGQARPEQVKDAAKDAGLAWRSVERARAEIGAVSERAPGFQAGSVWRLADADDTTASHNQDAAPAAEPIPFEAEEAQP